MNILRELVDDLRDVFRKRRSDFSWENYQGEEIESMDYCLGEIPEERVNSDFEKMLATVLRGQNELQLEEFCILIAAFCNFYIEDGMMFRLNKECFGLMPFFNSCDEEDDIYCVYMGVTTQDYSWFEKIHERNPKSIVANVYLLVREMAELTYQISIGNDINKEMEKRVWYFYENLSEEWREYTFQEGGEKTRLDKNPLPYVSFHVGRSHIDETLTQYMNRILERLDIGIEDLEPNELYQEICDKYGVMKPYDAMKKFLDKTSNKVMFQKEDGQNISSEEKSELIASIADFVKDIGAGMTEGIRNRNDTWIDMTILFEKLGYLTILSDKERKETCRFKILEFPTEEDSILYRYSFLHMSIVPYEAISKIQILDRYKLFMNERELERRKEEIERLNQEKSDLLDYYTHSWTHISYPTLVKNIAVALMDKKEEEFITMANKLFKAYNSERTLKHGIRLLQYMVSSDSQRVRNEFGKGFLLANAPKGEGIVGVEEIFTDSLDMVVLRLVMEDTDSSRRMKKCRQSISNIDELREYYIKLFLTRNINDRYNSERLCEWLKENNVIDLKISFSEEWLALRIKEESFSAAQLTEIFVEIITNIFLHGKEKAHINFGSHNNILKIATTNMVKEVKQRTGGKGLDTLAKVMEKINTESDIQYSVEQNNQQEQNEFALTINFDRDLMYIG